MKLIKGLKNKIILILIIIVVGNFILPKRVSAKSFLEEAGGKLLDPICELIVFIRRYYNR